MTTTPERRLTPDEERLEYEVAALREKRAAGWLVERLTEAPTHVAGCDDYRNVFAWYRISSPTADGGHVTEGYAHYPKDVEI